MIARAPRAERDSAMLQRGARFLTADFVVRELFPRLPQATANWSVEVARVTPARLTLRYTFDNGVAIYAKAYHQDLSPTKFRTVLPARAFQTIRRLWKNGFGPEGIHHVPEPLAYLQEENVMVLGAARGIPLTDLLPQQPIDEAIDAARAAARWLAQLHASKIAPLPVEPVCDRIKILKELDAVSRAAAASPAKAAVLLELLREVRRLAPPSSSPLALTPVHAQYTPSTVFLEGPHATAIDLDNVGLGEPAADVARFVSKLKWSALRGRLEHPAAERMAGEFLDEYRGVGIDRLAALPYYTALYALKEYAKFTLKTVRNPDRARAEEFCRSEISQCRQAASRPRRSRVESAAGPEAVKAVAPALLARCIGTLTGQDPSPGAYTISTVRDKGNGRLTLRFEAPPATVLYAKVYDHIRDGRLRLMKTLWTDGFDSSSRYRVPEILGDFPDRNLLLMAAAPGIPLSDLLAGDDERAAIDGVREAALWLAALHQSPVRIGRPEIEWDSLRLFRLAERFAECCGRYPELLKPLLDLLYWLRRQLDKLPERRPVVQTHGSYRPGHILIAPGITTAIDLDRSRTADPAMDAAEFIGAACSTAFDLRWDVRRLDRITDVFREAYLSQIPEAAASLPHYCSAYIALHLVGALRKLELGDPVSVELVDYHRRELERMAG